MIQAFDVLLQIPVTADIAAKNRIDEPFRYECLCCGEEVYIAATNSTKKAPHFRHRRGNSDRECELYLGSTGIAGALNAAQKRTHSRTEIYFDIKQKIFYAAVSFPKEKLQEFEDKSCILEFHSTYNSPPYEKVRINHQNFAPDSMVQFPLKLTTNDCYITISGANYRSHYEILSNNDFPTFFKITLGENSGNFARRIVGGKIYTNTSYYIIAKNQKIIQKIVDLGENIAISAVDEINALGSTIYGATLEILSVTPDLSNLFSYFNYSLEVSENITPLWPPLYSVDGVLCSNKKKVYLLSSFTLVPHSNISCENDKGVCIRMLMQMIDCVIEQDPSLAARRTIDMRRYIVNRWSRTHEDPIDEDAVALFLCDESRGNLTDEQRIFAKECREEIEACYRNAVFQMFQCGEMMCRHLVSGPEEYCRIFLPQYAVPCSKRLSPCNGL